MQAHLKLLAVLFLALFVIHQTQGDEVQVSSNTRVPKAVSFLGLRQLKFDIGSHPWSPSMPFATLWFSWKDVLLALFQFFDAVVFTGDWLGLVKFIVFKILLGIA